MKNTAKSLEVESLRQTAESLKQSIETLSKMDDKTDRSKTIESQKLRLKGIKTRLEELGETLADEKPPKK